MEEYTFVADSNGLSSLNPVNPIEFGAIDLYCRYNSHRFCTWGVVELEESVYIGLTELMQMSSEGPVRALQLIKSTKYSMPKGSSFAKNMDVIPNQFGDPFSMSKEKFDKLQQLLGE